MSPDRHPGTPGPLPSIAAAHPEAAPSNAAPPNAAPPNAAPPNAGQLNAGQVTSTPPLAAPSAVGLAGSTTERTADTRTAADALGAGALRSAPDAGTPVADGPRARISVTPPGGPPGAQTLDPQPAGTRPWATSRSGLSRLRIGGHLCSRSALDQLSFAGSARGMRLGVDRDGQPVTVRPFRPVPTRIVLVGGYWAAQVMVFRMLAIGAAVVVVTRTPEPWQAFADWAVGDRTRVRVLPPTPLVEVDAGPHQPALIVDDAGALGGVVRPGAWQTLLTVLPRLQEDAAGALLEADLVVLQRLATDEADVASSVLRLTGQTASLLPLLEPDMLALLGGGADRYVWVSATRVETGRLGLPQR